MSDGVANERQRHQIGADVEREPQIGHVFGGECRCGDVHSGQIQAFVIGYNAALDDAALDLEPIRADDVQAHHPIVHEDHVAGNDLARELRVGGRRPLSRSDDWFGRDEEVVAGREPGAAIAEHPETNPGTLQICEDRHEATGGALRAPHVGAQLSMPFVSSVGEVEACHVHAGAHQRLHLRRGRRRRSEGAHHLHPASEGRYGHGPWCVSRPIDVRAPPRTTAVSDASLHRLLAGSSECRLAHELAKHVGEDAAVAVVGGLVGGVDAGAHAELGVVRADGQLLRDLAGTQRRESTDLIDLASGQAEGFDRVAVDELERQDTHARRGWSDGCARSSWPARP